MMNSHPKITIIAVCFNQEKWVEETLNSILQQNYPDIQLIIADDGSTDTSKQIIRNWIKGNAPHTMFIDHEKNMGLTKNINSTLPFIQGDFFQIFGCDDIMLPHKISWQVKLFEENPSVGVIYSDMQIIDADGQKRGESYFEKHTYKKPMSGNIYEELIDRFIISSPSVLIRRNVLDKLKTFNESLDYEDHDFFLRAARDFSFLYMPEITVLYRVSGFSLSTASSNELKFYKNCFLIYYQRFDHSKKYREKFIQKLLFYTKKLYSLQYRFCSQYCFQAFFRTGKIIFIKYAIAALPFNFSRK